MLRIILLGLWICAVALGAFIFALRMPPKSLIGGGHISVESTLDYERTKVLDIPIIRENELKGYVVAQFVYVIDSKAGAVLGNSILADYINDALFEKFYGSYTTADQIDKVDVKLLKTELMADINKRLPKPFLKDLIVAHFSYYTKKKLLQSKDINLPVIH